MDAKIVVDIGFGDAGKGTMVDYFARQMSGAVIVRFNGGAQAAHNVVAPDGRHHTFSQFGSGSLVPGVRTFLSRFLLLDPLALAGEAEGLTALGLTNPLASIMVDGAALVVTPFQKAANRLREVLRGGGRHGSVGMGIGETMADMIAFPHLAVYARDLRDPVALLTKLNGLQELKHHEFREVLSADVYTHVLSDEIRVLRDPDAPRMITNLLIAIARGFQIVSMSSLQRLSRMHSLIFEGAQGVLIDEWHGFHPYTTWSTTTDHNAKVLLRELDYAGPVTTYGVVRTYSTRHGPGPFPSEDQQLTIALPDQNNVHGRWQGGFRVGWLDLPLTRYALGVCEQIDEIALTHLDRLTQLPKRQVVSAYSVPADRLTARERQAIVPVAGNVPDGFVHIASFKRKTDLEDLSYQEMLGDILAKASPVLEAIDGDRSSYVDVVSEQLGRPITVTSHGQTALHKQKRLTWSQVA